MRRKRACCDERHTPGCSVQSANALSFAPQVHDEPMRAALGPADRAPMHREHDLIGNGAAALRKPALCRTDCDQGDAEDGCSSQECCGDTQLPLPSRLIGRCGRGHRERSFEYVFPAAALVLAKLNMPVECTGNDLVIRAHADSPQGSGEASGGLYEDVRRRFRHRWSNRGNGAVVEVGVVAQEQDEALPFGQLCQRGSDHRGGFRAVYGGDREIL